MIDTLKVIGIILASAIVAIPIHRLLHLIMACIQVCFFKDRNEAWSREDT